MPLAPQPPEITAAPRRIKVIPPYGYPIAIPGQNLIVFPNQPAEVVVDPWVQVQLEAGVLAPYDG